MENPEDEISKMGRELEEREQKRVFAEAAAEDAELRESELDLMQEKNELIVASALVADLMNNMDSIGRASVYSTVSNLTDKDEVDKLVETADPESFFHHKRERVADLVSKLRTAMNAGIISSQMPLSEVLEAFDERIGDDENKLKQITRLAMRGAIQKEMEDDRKSLFGVCELVDVAHATEMKDWKVVRHKESIVFQLEFKDEASAVNFADSLPAGTEKSLTGDILILSGAFREWILDEAQEKFSWIRGK